MKSVKGELFTGYKGVRLEDLPEEAWRIVVGGGGNDKAAKLYAAVSWLYRCVDARAKAVSNMPWEIRRGETVIMTPEDDAPDKFAWLDDLTDLLYRTEAALALGGQAYWFRERNFMRTINIRWLRPDSVMPDITRDGLQGFRRRIGGQDMSLEVDDLVYFWLPDPYVELGPAEHYPGKAAMSAAGVLSSMDDFLAGYFDRGMIKATLLKYTTEMPISRDESARIKDWWRRVATGVKNAFATEVVRGNFDTITIGEGLHDLQNTALTAEQRESICTAMGVPQSKVTANAANFATKQSDDLTFITDTIGPECRWLASVINRQLLGPMGLRLEFNPDELSIMQEDEEQRSGALVNLVNAGMSLQVAAAVLGYDFPENMQLTPTAPAQTEGAPTEGVVTEKQVLNGAQIQSALSIIDMYSQGKLPRENAVFMVQTFFNISPDIAEGLVPAENDIERPASGDESAAERFEETRRFLRWARKRTDPDPDQFESVILSRSEKLALLGAAVADDAPFHGWEGYP